MQPIVEHWAGSKSEWVEGISWKRKDGVDRSMLGYYGMLGSPIYMFWAARGQHMPPAGGIPTVPLTGNLNNSPIWCITYLGW